jgi:signal transduction histidine kinase
VEGGQRALLRKYRELLSKHTALVQRLEERNAQHISTVRLSSWAMERSASLLALLRDGTTLMANSRWHALAREGPWQQVPPEPFEAPPPSTLRDVAEREVQALVANGALRVSRWRHTGGGPTLELRVERLALGRDTTPTVLLLAHDVTEQVRAEEELARAREALAEQEHLRALGELASGLAHDLGNTLTAMRLRLEFIQRDAAFAERQRPNLEALERIVSDASMRIQQLRTFARQQPEPGAREPVQLADVVRDALTIVRPEIEQRARREGLTVHLEARVPPLPLVAGSAAELRYVLVNLLLNARDAMPRGGTIRVHGSAVGGAVVLCVEDEGTGIPEAHLHSIFRPFFTTKGKQGTGLGLSMAYGVMARAGGSITAANRPEGGALFTLTFPVLAPESPPPPLSLREGAASASRGPARRPGVSPPPRRPRPRRPRTPKSDG